MVIKICIWLFRLCALFAWLLFFIRLHQERPYLAIFNLILTCVNIWLADFSERVKETNEEKIG